MRLYDLWLCIQFRSRPDDAKAVAMEKEDQGRYASGVNEAEGDARTNNSMYSSSLLQYARQSPER